MRSPISLRKAAVTALLPLALATGCSPREWVEVKVRDPSAATVEIQTPAGPKVVLPLKLDGVGRTSTFRV